MQVRDPVTHDPGLVHLFSSIVIPVLLPGRANLFVADELSCYKFHRNAAERSCSDLPAHLSFKSAGLKGVDFDFDLKNFFWGLRGGF